MGIMLSIALSRMKQCLISDFEMLNFFVWNGSLLALYSRVIVQHTTCWGGVTWIYREMIPLGVREKQFPPLNPIGLRSIIWFHTWFQYCLETEQEQNVCTCISIYPSQLDNQLATRQLNWEKLFLLSQIPSVLISFLLTNQATCSTCHFSWLAPTLDDHSTHPFCTIVPQKQCVGPTVLFLCSYTTVCIPFAVRGAHIQIGPHMRI